MPHSVACKIRYHASFITYTFRVAYVNTVALQGSFYPLLVSSYSIARNHVAVYCFRCDEVKLSVGHMPESIEIPKIIT